MPVQRTIPPSMVPEEVVMSDSDSESSSETETDQVPEPHQPGIHHVRLDPELAKDLISKRVQAQQKMADAALLMAQSFKKIADGVLMNAETNRMQVQMMKTMLDLLNSERATK